jgi:hypothetical protein
MKVTLTKDQVTEMMLCLKGALEQGKNLPYQWKYALSKNIDRLESESRHIENSLMEPPEFKKFNEERIKLIEQYCDTNENGEPIFITDQNGLRRYKVTTNKNKWEQVLKELESKDEYKKCVEERKRMSSPEFLNETEDYELHEIRVTKEQQKQLESEEISIPGSCFRYTQKIMVEAPDLKVV